MKKADKNEKDVKQIFDILKEVRSEIDGITKKMNYILSNPPKYKKGQEIKVFTILNIEYSDIVWGGLCVPSI